MTERTVGRLMIEGFGVVMMLAGARAYSLGGWYDAFGVIIVAVIIWQLAFLGLDLFEKRRT